MKMKIEIVPPEAIERIQADIMFLPLKQDLTLWGPVPELIDWRTNLELSKLLMGEQDEKAYMYFTEKGLGSRRIVALTKRGDYLRKIFEISSSIKAKKIVIVFPPGEEIEEKLENLSSGELNVICVFQEK